MTKVKDQVPTGWLAAGSNPKDYEFMLDTDVFYTGSASGFLKSRKDTPSGFGTLMQDFTATKYKGKRMKLSAFIKAKNVGGWSGLWMKVEGAGHDVLGFDNMKNRPITGSKEWEEYEIVLDVPKDSKLIAFGVLLSGKGSVWIDDVKFEEVFDKEVTNMEKPLPASPSNLNFQSN